MKNIILFLIIALSSFSNALTYSGEHALNVIDTEGNSTLLAEGDIVTLNESKSYYLIFQAENRDIPNEIMPESVGFLQVLVYSFMLGIVLIVGMYLMISVVMKNVL
jgi:hypothetical protein